MWHKLSYNKKIYEAGRKWYKACLFITRQIIRNRKLLISISSSVLLRNDALRVLLWFTWLYAGKSLDCKILFNSIAVKSTEYIIGLVECLWQSLCPFTSSWKLCHVILFIIWLKKYSQDSSPSTTSLSSLVLKSTEQFWLICTTLTFFSLESEDAVSSNNRSF